MHRVLIKFGYSPDKQGVLYSKVGKGYIHFVKVINNRKVKIEGNCITKSDERYILGASAYMLGEVEMLPKRLEVILDLVTKTYQ